MELAHGKLEFFIEWACVRNKCGFTRDEHLQQLEKWIVSAFGIEYPYSLTFRTQCHPILPRHHPGIPAAAAAAVAAPAPAPADAADCAAARTPSL